MKSIDGIILSCSGKKLNNDEIVFFKETNPFGFVLFSRNFSNKNQIVNLIKSLKKVTLNQNVLIFIDQEGGRVQRLKNNELVDSIYIQEFNKNYMLIKLKYLGNLDKMINQLETQKIILKLSNEEWQIKIL